MPVHWQPKEIRTPARRVEQFNRTLYEGIAPGKSPVSGGCSQNSSPPARPPATSSWPPPERFVNRQASPPVRPGLWQVAQPRHPARCHQPRFGWQHLASRTRGVRLALDASSSSIRKSGCPRTQWKWSIPFCVCATGILTGDLRSTFVVEGKLGSSRGQRNLSIARDIQIRVCSDR